MFLDYQKPQRNSFPMQIWSTRSGIVLGLFVGFIGLLGWAIVPRFSETPNLVKVAKLDIYNLSAALETFHADNGRYPTTAEGLDALVHKPAGSNLPHWKPIFDTVPVDPWGNPYIYTQPPSPHQGFKILSNGGQDGVKISN
jgi:general secretion pathway protein G